MSLPLNFKIYGSGDPIIILHGFMGSLDNWQTFAKTLSEDYMVITVDLRNHGKSPHNDGFSYELMVEDLRELMESEWIHQAVILGHSMGGKVAMKMAMMYPELVEKLIVVDIAPKHYQRGHNDVLEAMNAVPIHSIGERKEAEQVLAKSIADKGVRLFLMKNLKRVSRNPQGLSGFEDSGFEGSAFEWKVNLPVVTEKYEAILEQISGDTYDEPTLFIRGANSQYILDDDMEYIQSLFPESELQTIADAGHWIHAEQPKALMEVVREFVSRSLSSSRTT